MSWRGRLAPWLLAAAAGLVLALALPGPGWWPLVLLFPGLLLESVERVRGGWWALAVGLFGGTVHWAVAMNWVLPVMHVYGGLGWLAAVLCQVAAALFLGSSWGLVTWVVRLVPPLQRVWLLPLAWCAVEAGRQLPPYLFPWNPTAACVVDMPSLLGSLPVWGATGLGWAMVSVGAGLWALLRQQRRRTGAVAVAVAAAAWLVASLVAPGVKPVGEPVQVVVLQPGTSLEQRWDPGQWPEIADRVWRLSRQAGSARPDLLLWPEGAMPYQVEKDRRYREVLQDLARELDTQVVVNSVGMLDGGRYTNSAFLVTSEGVAEDRYDKVRLVPFGEYVPALFHVAFAESLVREVASFTPGADLEPLQARVPLGVAICYEIVFADLVAAEVRHGAQVLVTVTNDGWYGFSWAPRQHFAQAVLRAVENRRWLARAALTGISGFVDPEGRVVRHLELGEEGFLAATLQPADGITPRARFGDWWGMACAVAAVGVLAVRRRWARRQDRVESRQ